jgi:hypothetical protein
VRRSAEAGVGAHTHTHTHTAPPLLHSSHPSDWQAAHTERLHRGGSGAAEAPPPKMDRQSECSICLDEFEARQVLRRVGCGHVFHDKVRNPGVSYT